MATAEFPQPASRRRRWIVAGFLVFVAVAGWWYWPRGDARFVGKWRLVVPGYLPMTFTFHRHGIGRCDASDHHSIFSWHVEGDRLIIGTTTRADQSPLMRRLLELRRRYTGVVVAYEIESWKLESVSHGAFRGNGHLFTRLTE